MDKQHTGKLSTRSKLISSLIPAHTVGQEPEARPYLDGAEREAPPAAEGERARARRR
jgi:hypothetical protein